MVTTPRNKSKTAVTDSIQPPASTPKESATAFGSHDHSFTLQAIMELKADAARTSAEINALTNSIEKLADKIGKIEEKLSNKFDKIEEKLSVKIEKIEEKVSGVTHKIYAAGVVLVILVGVGGWVINKAWDMAATHLADIAKSAINQQIKLPSATTMPAEKH